MKRPVIIVALLGLSLSFVRAQELPGIDATAFCREINPGNDAKGSSVRACIAADRSFYDYLQPRWSSLPERARAECARDTAAEVQPSYAKLSACIERLRNATTPSPTNELGF